MFSKNISSNSLFTLIFRKYIKIVVFLYLKQCIYIVKITEMYKEVTWG